MYCTAHGVPWIWYQFESWLSMKHKLDLDFIFKHGDIHAGIVVSKKRIFITKISDSFIVVIWCCLLHWILMNFHRFEWLQFVILFFYTNKTQWEFKMAKITMKSQTKLFIVSSRFYECQCRAVYLWCKYFSNKIDGFPYFSCDCHVK